VRKKQFEGHGKIRDSVPCKGNHRRITGCVKSVLEVLHIRRTLHESSRRIYGRAHRFVHPPLRFRVDGRQRGAGCRFSGCGRGRGLCATGWTERGRPGHAEHGSSDSFSGRIGIAVASRSQFSGCGFSRGSSVGRPDASGSADGSPSASRGAACTPDTGRYGISVGLLIVRSWFEILRPPMSVVGAIEPAARFAGPRRCYPPAPV
jgi:hypothetical protein